MSDTAGEPGDTIAMALTSALPMAAADEGADIPSAFDPAKRYEVSFAATVEMPPFRYTPRDGNILMKGGALARILAEKGPDVFRTAVER